LFFDQINSKQLINLGGTYACNQINFSGG
jgi:hypothetical protein